MAISRFLFFSPKHHSRHAFNLLQWFNPSKRIPACSYTKSSRYKNVRADNHPVMPAETRGSRSWRTYLIPTGLLGIAGMATLFHYNDERRAIPKGQGNSCGGNTVKRPIIGGPFTLTDTENQIVTEKKFIGSWVLVYFGYTSSPDVGPEQVRVIAKAIDILESSQSLKVLPVFVTIDPQRDTPSHLRAYLREFDSRIVGLTGPTTAIRHTAQEYHVYFKKVEGEGDDYLVESSHLMYLMNPKAEVVRCFGLEYNAEELAEAMLEELKRTAS